MKKMLILLVAGVLFFSCGNSKKGSDKNSAIGLNIVFNANETELYKTASFEEKILDVSINSTGTILDINEVSYSDCRVKIKLTGVSNKKITGWCDLAKVAVSADDLVNIAKAYVTGRGFAEIMVENCRYVSRDQLHDFFGNIIEEGHKANIPVAKVSECIAKVIYKADSYYSYSLKHVKNPLFIAAKYNSPKLFDDLGYYFYDGEDEIIEPYGMSIFECAIRNDAAEVIEFIYNKYGEKNFCKNIPTDRWKKYQSIASESKDEKVRNLINYPSDLSFYEKAAEKLLSSAGVKTEEGPQKFEWRVVKYFEQHDDDPFTCEKAYIKTDGSSRVNMREEPSTESEKVGAVYNGSVVNVLGMSDDADIIDGVVSRWLKIESSEGDEGWVFGEFVYAEFDESPSRKTEAGNLKYYANFEDVKSSWTMRETKIIYQDLSEETLKPNQSFTILATFDNNSQYVFSKKNYYFPVCVARMPDGRAGVVNSADISNRHENNDKFHLLYNVLDLIDTHYNSQIIYDIACVYPGGVLQQLFLPGERKYYCVSRIDLYSDFNEITDKYFPVIIIYEAPESENLYDTGSYYVHAYTVKEGRMYNYLDFQSYSYEERDYWYKYTLDMGGHLLHRGVCCSSGETDHERWPVSELWTYGSLDSDPQIYVLQSHEDWVLPEW
ncbi:MAG: SH3 domain-containing protein [Treponema sp.]|nr:SH3 domain-containing protein [Treponema sp.]